MVPNHTYGHMDTLCSQEPQSCQGDAMSVQCSTDLSDLQEPLLLLLQTIFLCLQAHTYTSKQVKEDSASNPTCAAVRAAHGPVLHRRMTAVRMQEWLPITPTLLDVKLGTCHECVYCRTYLHSVCHFAQPLLQGLQLLFQSICKAVS